MKNNGSNDSDIKLNGNAKLVVIAVSRSRNELEPTVGKINEKTAKKKSNVNELVICSRIFRIIWLT